MPSTILSDNGVSSGTSGIKTTGSNDGALALQTTTAGGTATTAISIDTGQRTKFPTTIAVGDATPSTSGSGITFPATQSASSDANTLDDYEEGTWTPAIAGGTSAGSATYNYQVGRYTKIGNVVTVYAYLDWSSGTGSGTFLLTSLPFATQNVTAGYQAATIGYFHNIGLSANNVVNTFADPNTTTLVLYQYPVGGGASTTVTYDSAGGLIYSFTYLTN